MGKKLWACVLALTAALLLCGCGGLYDKEYVSVSEYEPAAQQGIGSGDKITVKTFAALKQALLSCAYAGQTEGAIVFDQAYEGDTTEDMASACWQVRTQDALCAYCVENIAYELNKIVTINEASVYISYSQYAMSPEEILHMTYSSGVADELKTAMESRKNDLVLLISRSGYDAEEMEKAVQEVYRENPAIVPREPTANVNMFSGTGTQRLYEISINYGMNEEELQQRTAQLQALNAFTEEQRRSMSDGEKVIAACQYLMTHCAVTDTATENTAYSALINGAANSEGLAFAYVELCDQLGLDCRIVYGQYLWADHCWNIVRVDGNFYHVDVSAAIQRGIETGVLFSDERFWGDYRWDVASYPKCVGELKYEDMVLEPQSA